MEIIISQEALDAARETAELGDRFVKRAEELGMENASFEDLFALLEQVEDEMDSEQGK